MENMTGTEFMEFLKSFNPDPDQESQGRLDGVLEEVNGYVMDRAAETPESPLELEKLVQSMAGEMMYRLKPASVAFIAALLALRLRDTNEELAAATAGGANPVFVVPEGASEGSKCYCTSCQAATPPPAAPEAPEANRLKNTDEEPDVCFCGTDHRAEASGIDNS